MFYDSIYISYTIQHIFTSILAEINV